MAPYELAVLIAKNERDHAGPTKDTEEWREELGDLVDDEEAARLIGQATKVLAEITNPIARLNAYTRSDGQGGIIIDVEGMALDFVTACKMHPAAQADPAGQKEPFLKMLGKMWDDCKVEVSKPEPAPTDGGHRQKLNS